MRHISLDVNVDSKSKEMREIVACYIDLIISGSIPTNPGDGVTVYDYKGNRRGQINVRENGGAA
jgi:hypothetical protein